MELSDAPEKKSPVTGDRSRDPPTSSAVHKKKGTKKICPHIQRWQGTGGELQPQPISTSKPDATER